MTEREKKICQRYSKQDEDGKVHCRECPLVIDRSAFLCKRNATYNRHTKQWEPNI